MLCLLLQQLIFLSSLYPSPPPRFLSLSLSLSASLRPVPFLPLLSSPLSPLRLPASPLPLPPLSLCSLALRGGGGRGGPGGSELGLPCVAPLWGGESYHVASHRASADTRVQAGILPGPVGSWQRTTPPTGKDHSVRSLSPAVGQSPNYHTSQMKAWSISALPNGVALRGGPGPGEPGRGSVKRLGSDKGSLCSLLPTTPSKYGQVFTSCKNLTRAGTRKKAIAISINFEQNLVT